MMKKYVVYYHENLNSEKTKTREFFKVESHPIQKKIWIGSKSNKVSLLEKLKIANEVVSQLDIKLKNNNENIKSDNEENNYLLIQSII
jgi:hypothetical protein